MKPKWARAIRRLGNIMALLLFGIVIGRSSYSRTVEWALAVGLAALCVVSYSLLIHDWRTRRRGGA